MKELREQYESLIEQEDQLLRQIQTGEVCLFTLLELMYRKDREIDLETAKEITHRIHLYTDDCRRELWQVRCDATEAGKAIRRWGNVDEASNLEQVLSGLAEEEWIGLPFNAHAPQGG